MTGIRTLDDIKGYCVVDEAGCWIWMGGYSQDGYIPKAHIPKEVAERFGIASRTMSAYRAAWLLSGKKIGPGQVVYRSVCLSSKCVNPSHCKVGTKGDMHARYSASGKNKGQPNRIIANMKNRAKLFLPLEKVQAIEAALAQGMKIKDIMAALHTDGGTVRKIRAGVYPTQGKIEMVHANSSIFALGRLAA